MMSSSSNEPPPPNPVLTAYEGFVQNTPLVTRYILTIQVISYITSWVVNPQYALANIPHFVLWKFEIYRLILSPLVNTSIISLVFAFMSFLDHGKRLEYSLGSTCFGWLCLMIGSLTNLLFLCLSVILWALSNREPAYLFLSAAGIWLILFGIIAMECAQAPRDSKRKFFVWDIPTLYYPLALYLLFALLGGGLSMSYFISIGLGYAYGFGKLDSLKLSSTRARRWEESLLANFTRRDGWVVGQAATGSAAWIDVESAGMVRVTRCVFKYVMYRLELTTFSTGFAAVSTYSSYVR